MTIRSIRHLLGVNMKNQNIQGSLILTDWRIKDFHKNNQIMLRQSRISVLGVQGKISMNP